MSDFKKVSDFEEGDIVYDGHGQMFEIQSSLCDGSHVVRLCIEGDELGSPYINYDKLYENPPVAQLSVETKELEERKSVLASELANLVKEINKVKTELKEIEKYKGLENLSNFINGKITHYVIDDCSVGEIIEFDKARSYYGGQKLLVLWGDSKGNMNWRLNRYSDGSGHWTNCYPCLSLEEAKAKISELFNIDFKKYQDGSIEISSLAYRAKSMRKYGLDVPVEAEEPIKEYNKKNLEQVVQEKQQIVQSKQADLDKSLKELEELNAEKSVEEAKGE